MGSSSSKSSRSSTPSLKGKRRRHSGADSLSEHNSNLDSSGRPQNSPGAETYRVIQTDSRPLSSPAVASKPVSRDGTPQGSRRQSVQVAEIETKSMDLMISYSHADKEFMNKIKDSLEESGIKVWVDVIGLGAGVDFLSKIGQAIIDAKLFVSILSDKSVESKYCQDELALAYVSNKPIIPVGIAERHKLIPNMDTGMRLQLAGFHWHMFLEEEKYDENLQSVLVAIQEALNKTENDSDRKKEDKPKIEAIDKPAPITRMATRYKFYTRSGSNSNRIDLPEKLAQLPDIFWLKHFGQVESIEYDQFVKKVHGEFKDELNEMYSKDDQQWLMGLLRRELEVEEDDLLLQGYLVSFCTVDENLCPLWVRIEDQARESYAMREVFNMESSVRVEAIENLGKFKSLAVVDALRDLLDDDEPNVRTVAAVSIAKTGTQDKLTVKKLLKTLNDKDRLVREAGCIALGRLKADHAVPRLVHMWRNDVISSVRDAAELALEQIGGPQAQKAMHITKILSEEIRMLAKQSAQL